MLYGEEHVRRYQETNGAEGYEWRNGTPILLLTTTGRRSGQARTSPLIFQPYGADYLVVASKGGADQPPGLVSQPSVESDGAGSDQGGHVHRSRADCLSGREA